MRIPVLLVTDPPAARPAQDRAEDIRGNSGRTCCWSSPYRYDLTIQWVTDQLEPAYAVLGSGYELPEDVRVSVTVCFAYVTERTGNLLLAAGLARWVRPAR